MPKLVEACERITGEKDAALARAAVLREALVAALNLDEPSITMRFAKADAALADPDAAAAERDARLIAAERERCAQVVEQIDGGRDGCMDGFSAGGIADAIRGRPA